MIALFTHNHCRVRAQRGKAGADSQDVAVALRSDALTYPVTKQLAEGAVLISPSSAVPVGRAAAAKVASMVRLPPDLPRIGGGQSRRARIVRRAGFARKPPIYPEGNDRRDPSSDTVTELLRSKCAVAVRRSAKFRRAVLLR